MTRHTPPKTMRPVNFPPARKTKKGRGVGSNPRPRGNAKVRKPA